MSFDAESLYRLLPAIHRLRDADHGYPLRQLVDVIASQVSVLEDEIDRLYENQFVETADPWALPYLGELLAITGLPAGNLAHTPRAEVGHTIAYRRRKGTAAVLELLARDTTGWPARAVEFFERLDTTQHLNHLRPRCLATASLRQASTLEFMGSPFEPTHRSIETRRLEPGRGRWNIPNVAVFLWRIHATSLTGSPLTLAGEFVDRRHFRVHPLNLDLPLFNLPTTESDLATLANPDNVPLAFTLRRLAGNRWTGGPPTDPPQFHPSESYYGEGRSLLLLEKSGPNINPIPFTRILVSDLRDTTDGSGNPIWAHEPLGTATGLILLDPTRGRVLFPIDQSASEPPMASVHYGAALNCGGGEYARAASITPIDGIHNSISSPIPAVGLIQTSLPPAPSDSVVVEINNSGRYTENALHVDAADRVVQIVARDNARPTVLLGARGELTGNASGSITLNGLLFARHELAVIGPVRKVTLRHCTLIPKASLLVDGSDAFDATPALIVSAPNVELLIEDCVLGPIQLLDDTRLTLRRSIVHAGLPTNPAISAADGISPAGTLHIENSTVLGKVAAHDFELVSNSILFAERIVAPPDAWPAPVWTPRRQTGCIRFTWLPADSQVPRRHECLPNDLYPNVRPCFSSLRPNHPAFGQLSRLAAAPIRTGADDAAAMGASHDLFEPQREAHLRTRLAEYLRFGLETGALFES